MIPLPDSIAAQATASGFEGVTVIGSGDDETVWLAVQREWGDDEKGTVKLVSYKPASQEWGVRALSARDGRTRAGSACRRSRRSATTGSSIIERDNQIGEQRQGEAALFASRSPA